MMQGLSSASVVALLIARQQRPDLTAERVASIEQQHSVDSVSHASPQ